MYIDSYGSNCGEGVCYVGFSLMIFNPIIMSIGLLIVLSTPADRILSVQEDTDQCTHWMVRKTNAFTVSVTPFYQCTIESPSNVILNKESYFIKRYRQITIIPGILKPHWNMNAILF